MPVTESSAAGGASAVLVVDGEQLMLARSPDDLRPVAPSDGLAAVAGADAVLVCSLLKPRRQRTGGAALAAQAIADLPFYAVLHNDDGTLARLLETARTPVDRRLVKPGAARLPVADIVVEGDGPAALLAAVFADLAAGQTSGADAATGILAPPEGEGEGGAAQARRRRKWRHAEIAEAVGGRVRRLARRRPAGNGLPALVHYRCGDGALALALAPHARYTGVTGHPAARDAARARYPEGAFLCMDDVAPGAPEEVDIFLLCGAVDDAGAASTFERFAAIAARRAVVMALVPIADRPDPSAGIAEDTDITALSRLLQRTFGTASEIRSLTTIAHKPRDLVPGTALVEFEVTR